MALNQDYFANILQTCLDEIQSGQAGFDEVLARYPDLAAELKPQLEIALWLQSKSTVFSPAPGFLQTSRSRIQNIVKYEAAQKAPDTHPVAAAAPRLQAFLLRFALAFVLVLAVIAGAGGVAFAARDTLPGDTLYPVKRTVERVQLAFTVDPVRKAGFQIQLVERRMMEVQTLVLENRFEDLDRAVRDYENQVQLAVQNVEEVAERRPAAAAELAAELQDTLSSDVATLNMLVALVPIEFQQDFQRLVLLSEAGVAVATDILATATPTAVASEQAGTATLGAAAAGSNTPTATGTLLSTSTGTLIPAQQLLTSTPTRTPTPTSIFSTRESTQKPTSTSQPGVLPTSTPKPPDVEPTDAVNTPSRTATNTPVTPATAAPTSLPTTAAPAPSNTPVPSNTQRPTATNTAVPGSTSTPVPSQTSSPSSTPVPSSTAVVNPTATHTPIPTEPSVPSPTSTPVDTATPLPPPTATATSAARLDVIPILESVSPMENGVCEAVWGYNNPNDFSVTIPAGTGDNFFVPAPQDQGQPSEFKSGRHRNVFSIQMNSPIVTWHIDGNKATAECK